MNNPVGSPTEMFAEWRSTAGEALHGWMGIVILVLGGTAEGRALAQVLADRGMLAMLSLAGRTRQPLTAGPVRSGGFGGTEGLATYLRTEGVTAVVDATHPFAESITHHAAQACAQVGVPLLRLSRPGWSEHPFANGWLWVEDHAQAATTASDLMGPVLLSVGRQHTLDYVPHLENRHVVARVVEPPSGILPSRWVLLCSKGPVTLAGERKLFKEHEISVLVTKDSGGELTEAKLHAAAELGAHVVMIRRPAMPEGLTQVSNAEDALAWLA